MNPKKLDKAARALMGMKAVEHKRPRKPTKQDQHRRFKLRVDRKGNPSMEEVG